MSNIIIIIPNPFHSIPFHSDRVNSTGLAMGIIHVKESKSNQRYSSLSSLFSFCPFSTHSMEKNSYERRLKMVSGAFYIPKDRMYNPKGEDAHFICKEKQTIGVADGVGRWIEKGVDSGLYARKLMSNFAAALGNYPTMENNENIDLKKVLQKAYSKTDNEGSSTTCILTLRENSLHAANVGDSGFLLIRDRAEFYKSPIQIKGFNFPYQLGKSADKPSVAKISTLPVQRGDVVILGTDGLFDNLFTSDIQNLVNLLSGAQPGQVARAVAEHAYYNSIDKLAATPFAKASFADGRVHYGGKKDDITVIVSFVV